MFLLVLFTILAPTNQGFTLSDLISIEKLETGTDDERVNELKKALETIENYNLLATPNEFRIVVECVGHDNFLIRAQSVSLLEHLTKRTAEINVMVLNSKRKHDEIADEEWSKIAFYLGHHKQIPGCDAYQAFLKHFVGRRCGDIYPRHREGFDFASHIKTKNLSTLEYALSRKLRELKYGSVFEFRLSNNQSDHLKGLIKVHPDSTAADLASQLLEHLENEELKDAK